MSAAAVAPPHSGARDVAGLRLLTVAHLMNDLNQGVLPAMIPWLVGHRHLSLALAATLVLAANLLGSVVQPLFGYLSDKHSTVWVIPVAILVATTGTALIGLAPTMPLMLLGAVLSGFGVAAFHPEASRFSNYFAGAKRASGMSLFTFGGYLGFAAGPLVATPLISRFGLSGVGFLLVPAIAIALLLARDLMRFVAVRRAAHRAHRERPGRDNWRAFGIMSVVVALRSTAFLCAVTFTEVFVMRVSGVNVHYASFALTALLLGGAFGTLYGGVLADRFDRRRVVTISLVLTMLVALALAAAGGHIDFYPLYAVLALAFGLSLGLSAGVLVVLGQEYLPKHIGIASGVTLGLANTIGGIAAPAFGRIGDEFGVVMIFAAIALSTALSAAGSAFMPAPARSIARHPVLAIDDAPAAARQSGA